MNFRRRPPTSTIVFLALAVASATAAVALMRAYARWVEATRPDVGPPVVVAARDLTRGASLTVDDVEIRSIPSTLAPPGAVSDDADVEGRMLAADIAAGEPVTRTRLAGMAAGPIAALVPPGLRAVTVPSRLPPGVVRSGDRIDVLATYGGGRTYTETVASALEVLMLMEAPTSGGIAGSGVSAGGPSIVLLVSPETAERLAYAAAFATISVAIEGPEPVQTPAA